MTHSEPAPHFGKLVHAACWMTVLAGPAPSGPALAAGPGWLPLFAERLDRAEQAAEADPEAFSPALEQLRRDADRALSAGPFSVTQKSQTPPSGDRRDYMSIGIYWWPDPDQPDGLPYIKRDGRPNPEYYEISDPAQLLDLSAAVETLSLGYRFFGDERYASRAARLLRTWFLSPETGMRPHLEYAQAVPGRSTGRGYGIIETRTLPRIVESLGLLAASDAWGDSDQAAMRRWCKDYLDWLQQSEKGRFEAQTHNNHGTYYDLQVVSLMGFLGREADARAVLGRAEQSRIASHIRPDGQQPHEIARTRSWDYSVMNLAGLMQLADYGDRLGLDLWGCEAANGGGLRPALDYLVAFMGKDQSWPHEQIRKTDTRRLAPVALLGAVAYDDPGLAAAAGAQLPDTSRAYLVLGVAPQGVP
ncbi:alginate lyase family protein [Botrimarina sp.]|uniref:alginate lyase family protein n=1 Tax=Botrimarina sp. TaxID=2795802 RepID=UPI0032EDE6E2